MLAYARITQMLQERHSHMVTTISPEFVGFIAGVFTTFASLPQIMRVLRTRSMNDVSLISLCMLGVGISLWLGYGIMLHAASIIIWNAIGLGMYLTQITLKLLTAKASKSPSFTMRAANVVPVPAS